MATDDRPWVKSYDEWVHPDLPIPDTSYVDLLEQSFRDFPDRPAYHFMGVSDTFRDLDEKSRSFAGFLAEIGCQPGDVVGICLPNTPQYMIAHTGTLRAGCVVSGVSPLLSAREMAHQLGDCHARVLVVLDAVFERRFLDVHDQVPDLRHVVVTNIADPLPRLKRVLGKMLGKIPTGRTVPVPGRTIVGLGDILRTTAPRCPKVEVRPEDVCMIMYTGGTTGPAKGAEITHRNLSAFIHQGVNWINTDRGTEVCCSAAPCFHIAGSAVSMWCIAMACTQVLIPDPRNTRHVARQIARHRPTFMFNVPSLYQMLLADPVFRSLDASVFEPLRACLSGAAPFSMETIRGLERTVGEGKAIELYGMTETTALVTMNPLDGIKKPGSVGLPIQNAWVKLVDLDTGKQEVPLGQEGEIIVSGPSVMKGYHNKPDETAYAVREFQGKRWMFTGDVGRMDDDGYVYIIDRVKDMINVGGFKVFSVETEEVLHEHPAVAYCAVVGLPNAERPGSELVKAVIQPTSQFKNRDGTELKDQIADYCRRNLAPYKVPKIIELVDEIPMTPVGKVDKKALR